MIMYNQHQIIMERVFTRCPHALKCPQKVQFAFLWVVVTKHSTNSNIDFHYDLFWLLDGQRCCNEGLLASRLFLLPRLMTHL